MVKYIIEFKNTLNKTVKYYLYVALTTLMHRCGN